MHVFHDWWCKDQRFHIPTCMFSCQKLTKLKLFGFEVRPPLGFRGFPCLKHLNICGGAAPIEAVENLISGCPLLEKFRFSNMFDPLALIIRAPNLKHLSISDAFKDIYLEHTPRLVSISIRLTTSLEDISFEQLNELLCVLHMIMQSPNLQELQFMIKLLIWIFGRECPADFTFKQLKIVDISFVSSENVMQFLKFVLGHSPVLEVMSISLNGNTDGKMKMLNKCIVFNELFQKLK